MQTRKLFVWMIVGLITAFAGCCYYKTEKAETEREPAPQEDMALQSPGKAMESVESRYSPPEAMDSTREHAPQVEYEKERPSMAEKYAPRDSAPPSYIEEKNSMPSVAPLKRKREARMKAGPRQAFKMKSHHSRQSRETQPWETTGLDTELWIIAKVPSDRKPPVKKPPRLSAVIPGEKKEIPLPLRSTDVNAKVTGFISTVDVRQSYHNPYDAKIEAVYVFPLPQSSAVTDFVMIVGDRKIRGLVREKEEAKRIYSEAKSQGYRASLLTQERPNIFRQKVANIEPGKNIDIVLSFFNPLQYRDGEYEFVFPTVVGPRFNPPGHKDGIGAVGRGKPGKSGQPTEVQYLKPGEKSGHEITMRLDIDAGVEIEKVYSRSHAIKVERKSDSRSVVTLSPHDRVPNKDFVVRYKTAGKEVKTGMMVHRAEDGNYFSLLLQPPENIGDLPRMPREMVFVLDCSGSMSGKPIAMVKKAIRRCLRNLDADDTFQIIRFSSRASTLGPAPVPATRENVKKGLDYLDSLNSGGGTMMIEGIRAALDFPHDERRLRIVSFMTDGYIGNEAEILAAVKQKLGASRIFSFGVGNSVNRYILERMAKMGRGAAAFIGLNDSAAEKVDQFYDRVSRPALANIEIDWNGLRATDVYPKEIPDLFVERPIIVTGRFTGETSKIRVNGRAGGERKTYSVSTNTSKDAEHPGIRSVWARWKIADLSDRENYEPSDALRNEIMATSLSYGLLSKYTAFLAVDGLERTKGDHGYSVNVPVPVPDGVRYDTTVSE